MINPIIKKNPGYYPANDEEAYDNPIYNTLENLREEDLPFRYANKVSKDFIRR